MLVREAQSYYRNWFNIVVRELLLVRGFERDPVWIAKQFDPPLKLSEAQEDLRTLETLGLVTVGSDGRLKQSDAWVSVNDEVGSTLLRQFHRTMIEKASQALDKYSSSEREVSSMTMSLSESSAQKIKKLMQKFQSEVLAVAHTDDPGARVYQLNFQLFPLTYRQNLEEGLSI